MHSLEDILRQCAQAAPNPWYPSAYAQVAGVPRDSLDSPLEQLRLAGLIQLTDWVPVMGQGYVLTPEGVKALQSPRMLDRIRQGQVPAATPYIVQMPRSAPVRTTTWDRGEAVREALLGTPAFPAMTFGLILVNVLVFLAGLALARSWGIPLNDYVAGGDNTGQVRFIQQKIGFLDGEDVYLRNQWWRILTACFGHVGILHLGVNMLTLYMVGPLLERLWGRTRFLLLYLLAGIGGSCGMLLENPIGGGAGASGALWGILASLGTWTYLNRKALPRSLVAFWSRRLLWLLVLNVGITFGVSNISKGGHFGGGLVGLIAAVPADWIVLGSPARRLLGWLGLLMTLLVCLGLVAMTYAPTRELVLLVTTSKDAYVFLKNEVAPALQHPANRPGPRKAQELLTGLAERQDKLERVVQTAGKMRIWWNPFLDRERNNVIGDDEKILADYARARRWLQ
jgi:membrane associated rhomboid family serine protease